METPYTLQMALMRQKEQNNHNGILTEMNRLIDSIRYFTKEQE